MSKAAQLIQKCLSEYNAKQLLPLELKKIKQTLNQQDASVESFKLLDKKDPIFGWYLVKAAWKATENKANHPFAADHAMSTIGIGGTQKIFAPLNPDKQPAISQEVTFSLSSSLLAAELAKNLDALSTGKAQTYWRALFFALPETILWHIHPKSMWRIYYRQLTLPKKMTLFEESKLGFNLHDWRIAVANEFGMSDQLLPIYHKKQPAIRKQLYSYGVHGFSEKTPTLREWHKQDAWLILLTNWLATSIIKPWHGRASRHICQMLQQTLNVDTKKITYAIHQSIEKVSHQLIDSQLIIPAVAMLFQPTLPSYPEWLVKPTINTSRIHHQKRSSLKVDPKARLSVVVNKLTNGADQYDSSASLVHDGLKAVISILNFSRVSFLGIDHKNKNATTRIALNAKNSNKIRPDFEFKLPGPLTKFIERQSFMLISRQQHQSIWHKLPQAIQKSQVEQFILCSLKPGKRVRAIIYIDAKNNVAFAPQQLQRLKVLLQALNKGLMQRNKAKQ